MKSFLSRIAFLLLVCHNQAALAKPMNVMLIVCDDLNTQVSTSGYPHTTTPAFDKLANAGMRFNRTYCQYPVCGPSRASFLSGLYPQSTGVLDNTSDLRNTRPGTMVLPQNFKEAGYWTGGVGKIFHTEKLSPSDTAWNAFLRFENEPFPVDRTGRGAPQSRDQSPPGYGPSGLRDEQHKDGKNARQIVSWLEDDVAGDKPFFMACGIQKPHVPFFAPDQYFDLYPKEDLVFSPTPANFWDQAPKSAMVKRFKSFGFELGVENDALRREYMQAYHACISFIDAQIGLVLKALERTGHWDDTIVILTSDHGYQLGEHFMWGKVTLFEVCDRVPLVIRVPGVTTAGSITEGLVELIDLYPTLTELCDVPRPDHLQGRSLVEALRDASAPGKEAAYTVVTRGDQLGKAIRTDRWRYTRWPDGEELYNLKNDPAEHENLAGVDEFAETLTVMRNHLAKVDTIAKERRQH
jgi:iduronate 2-sulfatase